MGLRTLSSGCPNFAKIDRISVENKLLEGAKYARKSFEKSELQADEQRDNCKTLSRQCHKNSWLQRYTSQKDWYLTVTKFAM